MQLQCNDMPLQLPQWSAQDHNVQGHNVQGHNVQGHNAIGYLENVPAYIRNTAIDNYKEPLNELNQRNFYKRKGVHHIHHQHSVCLTFMLYITPRIHIIF